MFMLSLDGAVDHDRANLRRSRLMCRYAVAIAYLFVPCEVPSDRPLQGAII